MTTEPVLDVVDLVVGFGSADSGYRPVNGVSFAVREGEILGVVGESGCGKSLTMAAVLGLLPDGGRIVGGRVRLHGTDLTELTESELVGLRGESVALVPSDAGAALNPVARIWRQAARAFRAHSGSSAHRREEISRVVGLLRRVALVRPEIRAVQYPHELSGGMQQRVAIAMALQNRPRVLIADEPTTALDVTVQAQILKLLLDVRDEEGTSIVLITHDLTSVAEICDRVVVMYAGRIVEEGDVVRVCSTPQHPYTRALIDSVPQLGGVPPERLRTIAGSPPLPDAFRVGCAFRDRCQIWRDRGNPEVCVDVVPVLSHSDRGRAACHFPLHEQIQNPDGAMA